MTKLERIQKQKERLAEMKMPEQRLHKEGYRYIAGVDEAGRGPLAGPVVAAAVILPEDFDVLGVDDSKKLTAKKRDELYDIIRSRAVCIGVGMADHRVIDEINILQATKKAMVQAINELSSDFARRHPDEYAQGGIPDYVIFDAMKIEEVSVPQQSVIKGDAKVLAVAAASIIAKVTRDRMMVEYAGLYPEYAFEKNKGYGTAAHYEGLRAVGPCPIHRRTFLKNGY